MSSVDTRSGVDPQQMLGEIHRGESRRVGQLLEVYRNYLSLLAESQLDRKLRARMSASDLVQETMLEAHRDFNQFRGVTEREFLGWLRRILVNNLAHAISRHVLTEKRDVRREVSLERLDVALENSTMQLRAAIAGNEASPSAEAERRETAVILADLMSQLPPQYREVLLLRNLKGLRFDEVAAQMGRTPAATKMLWTRAIKRIRQLFLEQGVA